MFPTLEVVVTETPAQLRKVMRPDLGIALIDLARSDVATLVAHQLLQAACSHMIV